MKYSGEPCDECGLPLEACNKIALLKIENNKLRAALGPFAKAYATLLQDQRETYSAETPDDTFFIIDNEHDAHMIVAKLGDFRHTLEVLKD